MANDLTGQNIQDTYKRVLTVGDDGLMYDGTGSLYTPVSASHEITTEVSSSYATTLTGLNTTVTELNHLDGIHFFNQDLNCTTPWFIDVMVENREKLMVHLKKNKIGSRVMYPPINEQKAYQIKGDFPVSSSVGRKGLWLPSSAQLTEKQLSKITSAIQAFYYE